ncbi:hypothetical protein B5X24_HaOG200964 [Helicoverpa armigera]|nr:hypothetical protein B5X24_HaOG200964 [Helicoverpa armigera]
MISAIKKYVKNDKLFMWLTKSYIFMRLLLGVYVKISESKLICVFIRFYCICIFFVFASIFTYNPENYSVLFEAAEYVFLVIYHFICENNSFVFIDVIKINDRVMGFKETPLVNKYLSFYMVLNSVLRYTTGQLRYTYHFVSWNEHISLGIALISVDISMWGSIAILTMIHDRIKILRKFIQSNKVSVNITGRDEVFISLRNIKKSLHYYDKLLDSLDLVNNQLQFQVNVLFRIVHIKYIC